MGAPMAGPRWLQHVWTAMFSAVLAVAFTLLAFAVSVHDLAGWFSLRRWGLTFAFNLVDTLTIGFVIQALFALARRTIGLPRLLGWSAGRRAVFFSGVPLAGVAIGWPLGATIFSTLRDGNPGVLLGLSMSDLLSMGVMTVLCVTLVTTWFGLRNRELRAEMRANEAQLRLLQGQMEPHFLFNTLANVISLIDTDAPRAKLMLEALTDYLRASLGGLRHGDSTLATELDLARRYLQLMRTRMGDRLRFEFKADSALQQATLMPLVLQPLIENAVKHGLEPEVDGGTVRVTVARLSVDGVDVLQVCVEDDGAGMAAAVHRPRRRVAGGADGNGIALANLRARLESRFGPRARLTLTDLEADGRTGTRACLVVPWNVAAPAAA